jgi:hypothetical protein
MSIFICSNKVVVFPPNGLVKVMLAWPALWWMIHMEVIVAFGLAG